MEEKLMALADFLELDPKEIKQSEYDENTFVTDNEYVEEEYLVFDDYDDAEEAAKQDVLNLFDDLGLDSFTESARSYIIDNFMDQDFLSDALRENFESYVDDIEEDTYRTRYENRLVDECVDAGIITEEEAENEEYDIDELKKELVDHLCSEWEGKEADYFIDNFGSLDEAFGRDTVESNLDLNAMAEWTVEEDGVAHFIARYDEIENEHEYDGTTYWIYRTN